MENATRALYISAGVLIGVMILSLAVMLFSSLQSYVDTYKKQIEFNDLNSFNSKYQQYMDATVTIQDIVTVAGIAHEDNSTFSTDINDWIIDENSLYVEISLDNERLDTTINERMQDLLEQNINKTYRCTEFDYSNIGRIYRMRFSEVK